MNPADIHREIEDLVGVGHRLDAIQNKLQLRLDMVAAHNESGKPLLDFGSSTPDIPLLVERFGHIPAIEDRFTTLIAYLEKKGEHNNYEISDTLINLGYEMAVLGNLEHYAASRLECTRDLAVAKAHALTPQDRQVIEQHNAVIQNLANISNMRANQIQGIDGALNSIAHALEKSGQNEEATRIRNSALHHAREATTIKNGLFNGEYSEEEIDGFFVDMTLRCINSYCDLIEASIESSDSYLHIYTGYHVLGLPAGEASNMMQQEIMKHVTHYYKNAGNMSELATLLLDNALEAHEKAFENSMTSLTATFYETKPENGLRPS